jgi:phosphohistidine phosphatase
MKTLLLMRHGKSSWDDESLPDHDRPLNKRGRRDAPRMGHLLRRQGLTPGLVIASDARRAAETASALADASGYEGDVRLEPSLYAAEPEAYLSVLRTLPDDLETVLVIGHNPGMEMLLEELTGSAEHLATAAIAQVKLPLDHWQNLSESAGADLVQVWQPRDLKSS